MIYIRIIKLFIKILFSVKDYKYFLEKQDGIGKSWTLYKRPIFQQKINMKKRNIPQTKAHEFIYHAFESLESKSSEEFKKEMFDNIALGIIWYTSIQDTKKQTINKIEQPMEKEYGKNHIHVEGDADR